MNQEIQQDHSLRGYLSRRTTEQLTNLLNQYLEDEITDYTAQIVSIILSILYEREKDNPIAARVGVSTLPEQLLEKEHT